MLIYRWKIRLSHLATSGAAHSHVPQKKEKEATRFWYISGYQALSDFTRSITHDNAIVAHGITPPATPQTEFFFKFADIRANLAARIHDEYNFRYLSENIVFLL